MSTTNKTSDKLSFGIIILIFGCIYLLKKIGLLAKLPYGGQLLSVGSLSFIAGVVFLITQPKKATGWVFMAIAVILNADYLFSWLTGYSYLLVPIALIAVGSWMIFSSKK